MAPAKMIPRGLFRHFAALIVAAAIFSAVGLLIFFPGLFYSPQCQSTSSTPASQSIIDLRNAKPRAVAVDLRSAASRSISLGEIVREASSLLSEIQSEKENLKLGSNIIGGKDLQILFVVNTFLDFDREHFDPPLGRVLIANRSLRVVTIPSERCAVKIIFFIDGRELTRRALFDGSHSVGSNRGSSGDSNAARSITTHSDLTDLANRFAAARREMQNTNGVNAYLDQASVGEDFPPDLLKFFNDTGYNNLEPFSAVVTRRLEGHMSDRTNVFVEEYKSVLGQSLAQTETRDQT